MDSCDDDYIILHPEVDEQDLGTDFTSSSGDFLTSRKRPLKSEACQTNVKVAESGADLSPLPSPVVPSKIPKQVATVAPILTGSLPSRPDNRIELLNQLVRERGWEPAQFFVDRVKSDSRWGLFLCQVKVNKILWAEALLASDGEEDAKRRIAELCRKNILNGTPVTVSRNQLNVKSPPPPPLPPAKVSSGLLKIQVQCQPDACGSQMPSGRTVTVSSETRKVSSLDDRPNRQRVKTKYPDYPENRIQLLETLVHEKGWERPVYSIERNKGDGLFWCKVIANGVEWANDKFKCTNEKDAKRKIAEQCRKNILRGKPEAAPTQEKEKSKMSNITEIQRKMTTEDPVKLLEELATSQTWVPPEYVVYETTDNQKVACFITRLLVNRVEWARECFYTATMQQAKVKIAAMGLRNILNKLSEKEKVGDKTSTQAEKPVVFQQNGSTRYNSTEKIGDATTTTTPAKMQVALKQNDWTDKLKRLALDKGWNEPEFYSSKQLIRNVEDAGFSTSEFEFSCRVVINGVEYQPDPRAPRRKTSYEAMEQVSKECLEKLKEENYMLKKEYLEEQKVDDHGSRGIVKKFGLLTENFIRTCSDSFVGPSASPLENQYWAIRDSVTITCYNFKMAGEAINALRDLIWSYCLDYDVDLARNWSLKLKTSSHDNNMPIVYIWKKNSSSKQGGERNVISTAEVFRIFKGDDDENESNKKFTVLQLESLRDTIKAKKGQNWRQWRVEYKSSFDSVAFSLMPMKTENILEIQTCRLLEYFCTFDVRCHHLIVLTKYWTTVNAIQLGEKSDDLKCLPPPLTLPYLVVFFLCSKGILPTPREIQMKPHVSLIDPVSGLDIGFNPDTYLAKDWTSWNKAVTRMIPGDIKTAEGGSVAEKVLETFVEFLQFLKNGQNVGEKLILNVRDGEWISMGNFLKQLEKEEIPDWISNMTLKEVVALRSPLLLMQEQNKDILDDTCSWLMSNPFDVTYKFSISKQINSILEDMGKTRNQLAGYLSSLQFGLSVNTSLESVLKVRRFNN